MFRYLLNVFVVIFSGYSFVVCGALYGPSTEAPVVLVKGRPCTLLASFGVSTSATPAAPETSDVSLTVTIPGLTALKTALRPRSGAISALPSFMKPPFNEEPLNLVSLAGMMGGLVSRDTSVSGASPLDESSIDRPILGVPPVPLPPVPLPARTQICDAKKWKEYFTALRTQQGYTESSDRQCRLMIEYPHLLDETAQKAFQKGLYFAMTGISDLVLVCNIENKQVELPIDMFEIHQNLWG